MALTTYTMILWPKRENTPEYKAKTPKKHIT